MSFFFFRHLNNMNTLVKCVFVVVFMSPPFSVEEHIVSPLSVRKKKMVSV